MIDFDHLRKSVYEKLSGEPSGHDYAHVMRVFKNAILIAQSEESVDMDVLKAAVLLHDMAYAEKFFEGAYAQKSEDVAKGFLSEKDFTTDQIEKILDAIRQHDIWVNFKVDVPIETKILRDADRLDYLGYTGIVRVIAFASQAKKNYIHSLQNVEKLENDFETAKGKELSKSRMQVVKDFLKELEAEY